MDGTAPTLVRERRHVPFGDAEAAPFVATLELAKSGRLAIRQDGPFGPIWLKAQAAQTAEE